MIAKFVFQLLTIGGTICLLVACQGNPGASIPIVISRGISIFAHEEASARQNEIDGESPLMVIVTLYVNGGLTEDNFDHRPLKVELNPGDDTGWIDLSGEYFFWLQERNASTQQVPSAPYEYTYTEPGEYQISARVTWWDDEVTTEDGPTVTVTAPQEPEDGQPSGEEGFDEEDEWVIRDFTDPRDGRTYEIIDGRARVAFFIPVDMDAAWQFVADENLDILSEWWMIGSISVLLPEETSVEEAVGDWPDEYPDLIESVDPDAVVEAD